ncbi:dedicator of cytokinesis protein 1-like isoform X2 [Athene noctua]|uniref:dedicator of cytokinesis protein 1-like isoform X4 n=1 Tax=Athene noctua TaxID=126797 RepID=UPI003EB9C3F7
MPAAPSSSAEEGCEAAEGRGSSCCRECDFRAGDIRSDICVTLVQGDFDKGSRTAAKTAEVTVSVYDEDGKRALFFLALVMNPSQSTSVIYYQGKQPRWFEM